MQNQSNFSEANNPTAYPLNGGIKPSTPGFPTVNSTETQRMAEMYKNLDAENAILRAVIHEKDQQIERFYTLLQAFLGIKPDTSPSEPIKIE
jgi:hypothetical protein